MKHGHHGCCCPCHKAPGLLIAVFGLTFLLKNLGVYDDSINNMIWPATILLYGLHKCCGNWCKCCSGKMACPSKNKEG